MESYFRLVWVMLFAILPGFAAHAQDGDKGKRLYEPCVACHGLLAEGGPQGPRLANQIPFYLEQRTSQFDAIHADSKTRWQSGGEMGDLILFLFRLPTPIPVQTLPQPADTNLGRDLYIEECAYCHGDEGQGRPKSTLRRHQHGPALAGQRADYLLSQMHLYQTGQRESLRMRRELKDLTPQQIRDLVAYILTVGRVNPAAPVR